MSLLMFLRRLGVQNQNSSALCAGGCNCPDILEMESGDFAIIGTDITEEARAKLIDGCGCGLDERVVRVPREVMVQALLMITT